MYRIISICILHFHLCFLHLPRFNHNQYFPSKNHIGRKISRIGELKDMKQEALAVAPGRDQLAISMLENSETIDEEKLKEVAKALGVSVEAIKNFSEENVINYFNRFNDTKNSQVNFGHLCTFNPLDKLVDAYEENRKLYERLISEI